MGTLAAAFSLGWAAVVVYLSWLGLLNRQLAQRLYDLEEATKQQPQDHRRRQAA
jgi:hypothetical protein